MTTNVVFPMAGLGSRFLADGYETPKPLLDVDGLPMIQRAAFGCNIGGRHIYVVQKEHNEKYNLSALLQSFTPALEVVVVEVDGVTEGAAASVLAAKEYIDNDDLLVICDSDTVMCWDPIKFLVNVGEQRHLDGAIVTFTAEGDEWSYVKTDEDRNLLRVYEKEQISQDACAGVYYWRRGSDFVRYAEEMIKRNERVKNEFYVSPVFNEALADRKANNAVGIYSVTPDEVVSLGTPERYKEYVASQSFKIEKSQQG